MVPTVLEDHTNWLPIKEAIVRTEYSRDHLTRLAREGKIKAAQVGRSWMFEPTSLESYLAEAVLEQEIRKRHLSRARRREREIRAVVSEAESELEVAHRSARLKAHTVAIFVLVCGALFGGVMERGFVSSIMQHAVVIQSATVVEAPALETPVQLEGVMQFETSVTSEALGAHPSHGVLLLPRTTPHGVHDIQDLFSDPVLVEQRGDAMIIVRTNEAGVPVGTEIPYVVVPVSPRHATYE
jgi:excisionase family DNA binding protein